ncbi:hypothetical protein [Halocynthiibacter styelae]|uniref:Uncharacterized protein n=1 Tax=Halocynthiibacter styelae TaxID=2761955 RepID=A0A8J7IQU4_9RHOB|nr:hypothetical protein [Paenihalocynthiibacter styelae]MBI1493701.1 hypothetical protein [Paenihalocynthiibacter styelae]
MDVRTTDIKKICEVISQMTEITKIKETSCRPFVGSLIFAMIVGPILITLVLAPVPGVNLVIFFAYISGMPSYLGIGIPVMILALWYFPPSIFLFMFAALLTQACIALITGLIPPDMIPNSQSDILPFLTHGAVPGLILGPIWAMFSGCLYMRTLAASGDHPKQIAQEGGI